MTEKVELEFAGRKFYAAAEWAPKLNDPEPPLALLSEIEPGEVFVDVGAGYGLYALRALAMGARVLAFEPHGGMRAALHANLAANGWGWDGDPKKVVDAVGVMKDAIEGKNLPRVGVYSEVLFDGGPLPEALRREVFGRHYPTDEELEHATLDSFAFPRVDWLKLDVEGAECGLLVHGARDTVLRSHPTLIVEDHDGVNPDPNCVVSRYAESEDSSRRIRAWLAQLGYRVETMPWGSGRKYIVARHPSRDRGK